MTNNVLFISHPQRQCGVHEFGKNVSDVIKRSSRYSFIYVECAGLSDLHSALQTYQPVAIIYNYYPSTLPWLTQKVIHKTYRPLNRDITVPQLGIMHEVTQQRADESDSRLFDYHIAPDPTLLLKNPLVFKTGRLVPHYHNTFSLPDVPVIGSFGFATPNKGFEKIVQAVHEEFDNAIIRFNIPSADFGDADGSNAKRLAAQCQALITRPGITLQVTHDFLNQQQVLDFLAQNSLNVFLYQDKSGRGLSSTVDYALAVDRPLAVSDSIMFRHLHSLQPPVVYGKADLPQIMRNGVAPLQSLKEEWSAENLVWEYERIIDAVLAREEQKKKQVKPGAWKSFKTNIRVMLGLKSRNFTWLRNTDSAVEDVLTIDRSQTYKPVDIPGGTSVNRVLDNAARELYKPAIEKLTQLVPVTMSKKIAEANVQQAFVFDTVFRYLSHYQNPRILCVGSYEDTAALSLKRMGYEMEEIDPVLNYYLQEYVSKPGVDQRSYDIIFSTSVIEHDPDDESFMRAIHGLLAPGGIVVMTCDYDDRWKPGDPKPEVDCRLYTQHDLKHRLLPIMTGCVFVDEPQWDCPQPDFHYLGKYQYSFAGMVLKKVN